MCTHNGAAYVEEQLRSILAQTRLPSEIVVSDDASSDGTVELVRSVLGEASAASIAVTVLQNPKALGVTANFQQALEACHGDLLALSDQDDVWYPDRLAVAAERFDESPGLLLLSSDARLVDAAGIPIGQTLFEGLDITSANRAEVHAGRGFQALLRRNLSTGATALLRRRLIEIAVPFPAPWVHDEWLAVIAAASDGFDIEERELIDYRQHDRNQIGARSRGLAEKAKRLIEPRGNRYHYLVDRSEVLLRRLESFSNRVSPVYLDALRDKLVHLRFREGLPASRIARVPLVLREAGTGRYERYSRGLGDVVRDLLQPE